MPNWPRNDTQELKRVQEEREREEREKADSSTQVHESAQHDRRALKAAYLRQKLAERERAEEKARKG